MKFPVATPYCTRVCHVSFRREYEMRYESAASFLSNSITAAIKKCISCHRYIPYQLKLFFHKVSLIVNILFPSLCEMLFAGIVKLSAEAAEISRALRFSSSSSAKRRPLKASFRGPKKMEFGRCYIGTRGRMRETSTPHCRNCPPWV